MSGTHKIDDKITPFLNSFDDFIFVLNSDGNIVFANKYATLRLGYQPEEMVGMNVLDVHPPGRREEAGIIVKKMIEGTLKTCPIPVFTKLGQEIQVETKVSLVRIDQTDYVLGISRDITDWIENNRKLSQSEAKFKQTFELSNRLMAISDLKTGVYYDVNEAFINTTGFTREEIIGHSAMRLNLLTLEARNMLIKQLSENQPIRNVEFDLHVKKQSNPILCSFDAAQFEVNGHKYLISTAEDITERRLAERHLAENRKQLQLILDATNDGFWDWNMPTGQVEFSNRWAEMLGYQLSEVGTHLSFWESLVHPDDFTMVHSAIRKHLEEKTEQYQTEHRLKHKNGDWIWVNDRGKVVEWDENGQPQRMVGTHSDITEKKQGEEKLRFRETFEQLINEVATKLINIPYQDIDEQIEIFLKKIGEFIGVDRAYVFLFNEDTQLMSNTHEWCRENIIPQRANLQDMPIGIAPWFNDQLYARQTVMLNDIRVLLQEAENEYNIVKAQDIKSLILVPLINYEQTIGFIGFDAVIEFRKWDIETELLLKNSAITIVNALQRKQHEIQLSNYRNHLESLIRDRTKDLEISNLELSKSYNKLARQHEELVKFKNIADKANYGILIMGASGLVQYANKRLVAMVGIRENKLIHSSFIPEFIDSEGPNFQQLQLSFKKQEDLGYIEVSIRLSRGRRIPVLANVSAIRDIENQFLFFVVSIVDLTERKKEEQEMKVLWQAIEHSGNGIMITDDQQNIIYTNQQYLLTCGFDHDELCRMGPGLVRPYKEEDEFYQNIRNTIRSGNIWKGHLLNRKKDGTEYTDDTVISPVINSTGMITHFIAITRDITQELRHEKEIRQSEKLRALGTLAGGVAHDFNNILQIIQVHSELIDLNDNKLRQFTENTEEIQRACQRGKSLINNILTFSRQEPTEMAFYNFDFLVREIIKAARPLYPSSIEINSDVSPVGMVLCDPVQIQQIFFNLLNNASDAMNRTGRIDILLERIMQEEMTTPHNIRLRIEDNGKGMAQEILERAFEPFFTTKKVGEGTGLGLFTVMGIVNKHNAQINISSECGTGTRIDILFHSVTEKPNADLIQ